MRESIVQAVSAYVDIETEEEIEVNLSTDPELGTIYSVAVPVRRVKSRRIGGVDTSEDGKIIVKVRGDSSGGLFLALQALMAWGLGMRSSTLSRRVACPVCFGPLTLTSLPCSGIQRTPTAIPVTSSPLACEVPMLGLKSCGVAATTELSIQQLHTSFSRIHVPHQFVLNAPAEMIFPERMRSFHPQRCTTKSSGGGSSARVRSLEFPRCSSNDNTTSMLNYRSIKQHIIRVWLGNGVGMEITPEVLSSFGIGKVFKVGWATG